jgi:hypothetical protein
MRLVKASLVVRVLYICLFAIACVSLRACLSGLRLLRKRLRLSLLWWSDFFMELEPF